MTLLAFRSAMGMDGSPNPKPVLTASYTLTAATNLNSLVTPSFTPFDNEVIVVKISTENQGQPTIGTPTGGSLTYTQRALTNNASSCAGAIYTAVVGTSPGSMTVTVPFTGSTGFHSATVERWSNAALAATPATTAVNLATGTAPSTTITTVGNNSVVSWLSGDWSASSPTTRAYRSGAVEEGFHDGSPNNYVAYYAYQAADTAGSQTVGMTSPTQKATIVAIEIKGVPVAATGSVSLTATPTLTADGVTLATRFYLPASGTAGATPAPSASWGSIAGTSRMRLPTTKTNTPFDSSGVYSETSATALNVLGRQFVSDPIDAQTISGTFSLVVACLENATTADASLQAIIRVVSSDGSTVRGTLYGGHSAANNATVGALGEEMSTSGATRIMSGVALTPVVAQAGDRIVLEVGGRFANTTSTSQNMVFQWGDPTSASDYALTSGLTSLAPAAWFELSQNIAFQTGTTYQGATSLSATATLTADGIRIQSGAVSLAATSTLTSAPTANMVGAVSLTSTSSLSANGIRQTAAATTMVASPTLSVNGIAVLFSSVSLTATGLLTSAGVTSTPAQTTLTATATLSAGAQLTAVATTSLSTTATLSVAGLRTTSGSVALAAAGSLSTAARLEAFAGVSLPASGLLSVDGVRITSGLVTLSAAGSLSVQPFVVMGAAANLASAVTLSVTLVAPGAGITLTAIGVLAVNGIRTTTGAVSLSAAANLASAAFVVNFSTVTLNAASTLSANGIRTTFGVVSLTTSQALFAAPGGITGNVSLVAVGSLSVTATQTFSAAISLSNVATLSVSAVRTTFGVTSLTASATLSVNPTLIMVGSVSASAVGVLTISGILSARGVVNLSVLSNLTVIAGGVPGACVLNVSYGLVVDGVRVKIDALNLATTYSLSVGGFLGGFSATQLTVLPSLNLAGRVGVFASVGLDSAGQLTVGPSVISKLGTIALLASVGFNVSIVGGAAASVALLVSGVLGFIDLFPQIHLGAGGEWDFSGIHPDVVRKVRFTRTDWSESGIHKDTRTGVPRRPIDREWTTAGIHSGSTRA